MEPIGQTLREARERKGVTLQEAREALRIHAAHLDALEAEEFEKLPAPAYGRAFLRQYAAYLELDPEPLVAAYNGRTGQGSPSLNVGWSAAPTAETSWSGRAAPAVAVGTLMVLLLGGVYGVHLFLTGKEEARRSLEEAEKARKAQVTRKAPATTAAPGLQPPAAASVADKPGAGGAGGPTGATPAPAAATPAPPGVKPAPAPAASVPAGATAAGKPVGAQPPATPVVPPAPGATTKPIAPPPSAPGAAAPTQPGTPQSGGEKPAASPTPGQEARGGIVGDGASMVAMGEGGQDAAEATQGRVETTIRVKEKCWVRVRADGKLVFEGTLQPGAERTWGAGEAIDLVMGNAGGVRLTVNGEDLGPAGRPGQVVRRVFRRASGARVAGGPGLH